ncbi:hypothetical protein E2P81_ATG10540 [Venturia nashicola]|nr:hypothetical protein E2P81_ATG10540 [Venturia nashicola]
MCIVEQKTYYQPDGSQKAFDRVNRCEFAISTGISCCSNATRTSGAARIVEVKPETTTLSSSKKPNEIVTETNGHKRVYRGITRRPSHKHKSGHSKRSDNRNSVDGPSTLHSSTSEAVNNKRPSAVLRPVTPSSAPPRMSSFPPSLPSEHSARVDRSGTAVYDLPPSLNMPRAWENERRPADQSARKVSFETETNDQSHIRRPGLSVNTGTPYSASPPRVAPGLSRLPSLRQHRQHKRTDSALDTPVTRSVSPVPREDSEYATRQAARETARRQKALDEAILRRQEELEDAENRQLDREAERAQYRRTFDPLRKLPETLHPSRDNTDSEHSTWSRHTSPPAPPSRPRPVQTRTRFASSSPLASHSTHRHRSYGHATVHQYHYPDPPVAAEPSRRPSDSIRDRGREVIERERAKAAAEDRMDAAAAEGDAQAGAQRYEPVFDEVEERLGGRECYYVSEGSARQEIRRRRERDDSRRREERRSDFFYR